MTGRGVDQILPHPGDPVLYESYVRDAREYVALAEMAHGRIPRPVDFDYVWGEALGELERAETDARIINLETSITSSSTPWAGKGIHYRMHPANVGCITAARVTVSSLANNHVLDWGYVGLSETLETLKNAGVLSAGAGQSTKQADAPAVVSIPAKGRVLVFGFGTISSGIPREWAAGPKRAGVRLLPDLSEKTAGRVASEVRRLKKPGDVAVASVHWGGNWGYSIPEDQIEFAHRLIEGGIDLVHGHSSHHVKGMEVYRDRLVLYGCGDFLTDYEGIGGYENFRGDLAVMYLVRVNPEDGRLVKVRLVPFQVRRFQLARVSAEDAQWLHGRLNELCARFGATLRLEQENDMVLRWRAGC